MARISKEGIEYRDNGCVPYHKYTHNEAAWIPSNHITLGCPVSIGLYNRVSLLCDEHNWDKNSFLRYTIDRVLTEWENTTDANAT